MPGAVRRREARHGVATRRPVDGWLAQIKTDCFCVFPQEPPDSRSSTKDLRKRKETRTRWPCVRAEREDRGARRVTSTSPPSVSIRSSAAPSKPPMSTAPPRVRMVAVMSARSVWIWHGKVTAAFKTKAPPLRLDQCPHRKPRSAAQRQLFGGFKISEGRASPRSHRHPSRWSRRPRRMRRPVRKLRSRLQRVWHGNCLQSRLSRISETEALASPRTTLFSGGSPTQRGRVYASCTFEARLTPWAPRPAPAHHPPPRVLRCARHAARDILQLQ